MFGRLERVRRIAKDIQVPKQYDYLQIPKIQTLSFSSNI